jgi:hypothetical protein
MRALFSETFYDGGADAAAGASDERAFVLQGLAHGKSMKG